MIYRHLAEEIRGEYSDRSDKGEVVDDLVALAKEIIPYNMQHNAETEACDLLMEIEQLELLEQYVDQNSFQRVCLYLTRFVALHLFSYDNLKCKCPYRQNFLLCYLILYNHPMNFCEKNSQFG